MNALEKIRQAVAALASDTNEPRYVRMTLGQAHAIKARIKRTDDDRLSLHGLPVIIVGSKADEMRDRTVPHIDLTAAEGQGNGGGDVPPA